MNNETLTVSFSVSEHQCITRKTCDLRWVKKNEAFEGFVMVDDATMILEQAYACIQCGKVTWEMVPIFDAKTGQYLRLNMEDTK